VEKAAGVNATRPSTLGIDFQRGAGGLRSFAAGDKK
jgi:hypothetical protein